MSFLARLFTLIVAFWAALRLLRMLFRTPARRPPPGRPSAPGRGEPVSRGRMVRDRVCGTYLPENRALTLAEENETLYFCGATCREKHLAARSGGEKGTPAGA